MIRFVLGEDFPCTLRLYERLMVTNLYTFVYVYSPGESHSLDVWPEFEKLAQLFLQEDGQPLVEFASINGRKSRNFARDFNVESFPQLMLFGPRMSGEGPSESVFGLLRGVYRGGNNYVEMGNYLGRETGHLPHWRDSVGVQTELYSTKALQDVESIFNSYWRDSLDFHSAKGSREGVVLIAFVTPWTRSKYQNMFLSGAPDAVVDQLNARYGSQVQFLRLDAAQKELAPLVNAFRVSTVPSVFLLLQDGSQDSRVVLLELLAYDSQTLNSERQLLSELLDAATTGNFPQLQKLTQDYHSVYLYNSLQERQQEIWDERDLSLVDEGNETTHIDTYLSSIWSM